MSVDYDDEILKSDSDIIYPDYIEYARITFGDENSYFMKTEKITIGRNSADGTVDIDVGPHTFVSRKHLEMMYSYKKLKVKCLGKNGIFIDNYFKAHSAIPYELPYDCTLRFPSTNVEVNVQQLVGRRNNADYHDDLKDCCETRAINRKRKAQKSSSTILYNFYDTKKEVVMSRFDLPLCRASTDVSSMLVRSDTKVDSSAMGLKQLVPVSTVSNNSTCSSVSVCTGTSGNSKKPATTSAMALCGDTAAPGQKALPPSPLPLSHGAAMCTSERVPASGIPQIVLNSRAYRSYCTLGSGGGGGGDVVYTHGSQVFGPLRDAKDLAAATASVVEYGSDTVKPPYSYAQLIVQAVSSSRDRQLTLNGIYNYISKHYPYFKSHDKGWQNSVRHNLSLNRYFIKVPRGQDEPGKGSFWRVDGAYESKLVPQAFRKRRLRSSTHSGNLNCAGVSGGNGGGGSSICSDHVPGAASRLFHLGAVDPCNGDATTVGVARSATICTLADRRHSTKLNSIFTLRRADSKTPTTFVFRKISESQQLVGSAFGAASALTKSQSQTQHPSGGSSSSVNEHRHAITKISSISPDHVFQSSPHQNVNSSTTSVRQHALVSSHAGQKSHVFHSPVGGAGTTTNTLISIGGQVFSTSKLKPIQLLATGAAGGQGDCDGAVASRPGPFTPVKQAVPPASTGACASKYILITSSHGDRGKSVAALDEGILHATPSSVDLGSCAASQHMGGSLGSSGSSVNIATALASPLPMSQSLSLSSSSSACSDLLVLASSGGHSPQTVCAQRRSHVLGASVSIGAVSPMSPSEDTCGGPGQLDPGSPDLRDFSQSLRRGDPVGNCVDDDGNENEDDDELDLEMDQFLDSYSILDQPQDDDGDHDDDDDIDSSPPDLYKDDIDDYCVWQHDDSFGLQDVEIEIH